MHCGISTDAILQVELSNLDSGSVSGVLTQYFNIDCSGLDSTGVLDSQDVSASVVSVTVLDDGHGSGGSVGQGVLLSQLQNLVSLGPEHFGFWFSSDSAIQDQV